MKDFIDGIIKLFKAIYMLLKIVVALLLDLVDLLITPIILLGKFTLKIPVVGPYIAKLFGVEKTTMKERIKVGVPFIMGVILLVYGVIVFKAYHINAKNGEEYSKRVLSQAGYTSEAIPYKRGDIYDVNGNLLATTNRVYTLILEPANIIGKNEDEYNNEKQPFQKRYKYTSMALEQYFGMSQEDIDAHLFAFREPDSNKSGFYEQVEKGLTYDNIKEFKDMMNSEFVDFDNDGVNDFKYVKGIRLDEGYKRIYPNGSFACHIVGFSGANSGIGGIEATYNDYLNGVDGRKYNYLGENNELTSVTENPVNGYNIVSSLDGNIQRMVEETVDEHLAEKSALRVSVVVMDPDTCKILALYNNHNYDLNNPNDLDATRYQYQQMTDVQYGSYKHLMSESNKVMYPDAESFNNMSDEDFEFYKSCMTEEEQNYALNSVWKNFAVSEVFEPGSTFKTFVIAGALEEGVVTPDSTFMCDGYEMVSGFKIRCHIYSSHGFGHGVETLSQALENSCNDALMEIAKQEGRERFDKYQEVFGFGQKTNIDLPGEQSDASLAGLIYHADTLNITELATSSFGQSVSVTEVQMATAYCSVINGGYYYQPSVVDRIVDEDGNIIKTVDPILVRKTVSKETSDEMKRELFNVVDKGTGYKAQIEGYSIGGKTGTAEKRPRGTGKYVLSFVGFAPVDKPEVLIYVVIDEPEESKNSLEGKFIFRDIADKVLPYLNVYKDNDNAGIDILGTDDNDNIEPIYDGDTPDDDIAGNPDEVNQSITGDEDDN